MTDLRTRQTELGFGLMRDGNGPRARETLVRYRGAVLAELLRALGALKALQAEADALAAAGLPAAPTAHRHVRCSLARRNLNTQAGAISARLEQRHLKTTRGALRVQSRRS